MMANSPTREDWRGPSNKYRGFCVLWTAGIPIIGVYLIAILSITMVKNFVSKIGTHVMQL